MRARALALLMLAASSPACGSAPEDPMTITAVIARINALNGRTVQVAGYLGECRGYDCRLFRNANEARASQAQGDRYLSEVGKAAREGRRLPAAPVEAPWLGIGEGENARFDRAAAPYQNSYVVITGRVTNMCRHNGQPGCVDRSIDVQPTDITRWSPQSSDAGNLAQ